MLTEYCARIGEAGQSKEVQQQRQAISDTSSRHEIWTLSVINVRRKQKTVPMSAAEFDALSEQWADLSHAALQTAPVYVRAE